MKQNTIVKYRTWHKGLPPKRPKLQIPGWIGQPGYKDGCAPQAWHCKPFVDAATYGLELVYPWDSQCTVTCDASGELHFDGDFTTDEDLCGMKLPPFMSFAQNHYGFTSSLDIETQPGYAVRIEPAPRFYTDTSGETPIAVAGHIEAEWWPRIFFVVFKSPRPGEKHVFRKGEAYAQILIVPKQVDYEIRPMTPAESLARNTRDAAIVQNSDRIATHSYRDHKGHKFNNKYKTLSKIYQKHGTDGVDRHLSNLSEGRQQPLKKLARLKFKKIGRKK